ncbi:MAG: TonB family protein [Terracidiphilus sp.]|jgi:protein TonB
MASPEELTPLLPETLPEDFGEWDGEASPEASPIKPGEWEAWEATHSLGETKSSSGQSSDRGSTAAPPAEKPRASGPAPSAPAFVAQQKHFVEWDGETPPPTPKPVNLSEWEAWEAAHSFGKSPKPTRQTADHEASLSPVVEKPRVSSSVPPAPFTVKQQELTSKPSNGANGSNGHASNRLEASRSTKEIAVTPGLPKPAAVNGKLNSPEVAKTSQPVDDRALFQIFSEKNVEVAEKPKTAKKKWVIIAPVSAGSVLLLLALMFPLFHHGAKPAARPSVQGPSQGTDTQSETDPSNTPESTPAAQTQPAATTAVQSTANTPVTNGQTGVKPAPGMTKKQAKMMDDQLTAPTVIPQGTGRQDAENAPPPVSIGSGGADGLGGASANDSVLNGRTQPAIKVVSSRPFAISSGVATGMLIRQTAPVYPPIAKAARVSGTVVLHATIAKNGAIKDLQVVSGSPMLQQAAMDAVRTWRYKPYTLSNEPVEVDTTISVVFTLGK